MVTKKVEETAADEAAPVDPATDEAVPAEAAAEETAPADPAADDAAPADPEADETAPADPAAPAEPAPADPAAPAEPAAEEKKADPVVGYSYSTNGSDWGSIEGMEQCSEQGGSPIDVSRNMNSYDLKYDIRGDDFSSNYSN